MSTNFLLLTPLILSRTGVWLSIMDRSYVARLGTMTWSLVFINAGIVQRSGVDSFSYDVVASDLHPESLHNNIVKYADDT